VCAEEDGDSASAAPLHAPSKEEPPQAPSSPAHAPFMVPLAKFFTTVLPAAAPENVQPFGWLGGATRTLQQLLSVVMGRIPHIYLFRSVQNCQLLVLTSCLAEDACVRALVLSGERLRHLGGGGGGDSSSSSSSSSDDANKPPWAVARGSGGSYGKRYSDIFSKLVQEQRLAAAVEQEVLGNARSAEGISAFATVQYEQAAPDAAFRFLNQAEWETALGVADAAWAADIQLLLRPMLPSSLPPDARPGACADLLRQQAALETARRVELRQKAAYPAPPSLEWQVPPPAFLQLTLLCAHPGRAGAGAHTLRQVCALADALGQGVLLSALHVGLTLTYYARQGFRAVQWKNASKNTLEQQLRAVGSVHMWRPPRAPGEGASTGAAAAAVLSAELLSHGVDLRYTRGAEGEVVAEAGGGGGGGSSSSSSVVRADGRTTVTVDLREMYPGKRKNTSKLEEMHLSVASYAAMKRALAWKADAEAPQYSWALEVLRQLRAGRIWPGCALVLPPEEPPPVAPAATSFEGSRKRAREAVPAAAQLLPPSNRARVAGGVPPPLHVTRLLHDADMGGGGAVAAAPAAAAAVSAPPPLGPASAGSVVHLHLALHVHAPGTYNVTVTLPRM